MSKYTQDETNARMAMLMDSQGEILLDHRDKLIAQYHEQLEVLTDFGDMKAIQGKIAGVREFCMVIDDLS